MKAPRTLCTVNLEIKEMTTRTALKIMGGLFVANVGLGAVSTLLHIDHDGDPIVVYPGISKWDQLKNELRDNIAKRVVFNLVLPPALAVLYIIKHAG
jgi:hypothetical protein